MKMSVGFLKSAIFKYDFFEKAGFSIEPFVVINGKIDSLYRSMYLANISQIDYINFWVIDYDEYGTVLPQDYPNDPDETQPWHTNNSVPYEGMGYVFDEAVCTFEAFSNKTGYYTENVFYAENGDIL